jgi:hypothetical protein
MMEKISESIYRYDGKLESDKKPLVLVHPWFEEGKHRFKVYLENPTPFSSLHFRRNSYQKNLIDLLRKSADRNIFLFEEYGIAEKNCNRVSNLTKKTQGIYTIKTHSANPLPLNNLWGDVIEFIKEFSNEVDIAGGYLDLETRPKSKKDFNGCAGIVYEKLKENGIKPYFVKGCCFTRD